ncbi:MAG: winged helix-turn-helix transcriptional regulator, partial [Patescibacteria group bacterium]|nr:winged helix-turn-helix transcriptional regulator [Patescibacteria group bacterium]
VIVLLLIWRPTRERIVKIVYKNANKQSVVKEKNKEKILELIKSKKKITNNDVEKNLEVSDATATRYLNELEKDEKIKQVGKTGKYVYYKKV